MAKASKVEHVDPLEQYKKDRDKADIAAAEETDARRSTQPFPTQEEADLMKLGLYNQYKDEHPDTEIAPVYRSSEAGGEKSTYKTRGAEKK